MRQILPKSAISFIQWSLSSIIVACLVMVAYRFLTDKAISPTWIREHPEVIIIGLGGILGTIFLQQLNHLRSEASTSKSQQIEAMARIQEAVTSYAKNRIDSTVGVAQGLDARVQTILKENPWIEAITSRDLIVESDSVKATLMNSYSLFRSNQLSTLYEFLEHSLKKGTSADRRDYRTPLSGSPEDFIDLAEFCEIYMQDDHLGTEFILYYRKFGGGSLFLQPDYLTRLLRVGRMTETAPIAKRLKRMVEQSRIEKSIRRIFGIDNTVSELMLWKIQNALALHHAYEGREAAAASMLHRASESSVGRRSPALQLMATAEVLAELGKQQEAREQLAAVESMQSPLLSIAHDLSVIYRKIGDFDKAEYFRKKMLDGTTDADEGSVDRIPTGDQVLRPVPPKVIKRDKSPGKTTARARPQQRGKDGPER